MSLHFGTGKGPGHLNRFSQGSGSSYTPPIPTGLIQVGDSRIALGGTLAGSGSSVQDANCWGHGYNGVILSAIDNAVRTFVGYNYGVNSSTSRALEVSAGRLSSASIAGSGNPANADTGAAADALFNTAALGDYSPVGHPANLMFFLGLINDRLYAYFGATSAANALGTMQSAARCFDQLGAAGKVIFAGETPLGKSTFWSEKKTIAANSVTATNTTGFVDGSAFPTPVAAVITAANTVLTKVASAPGVGQYSVSAGGVYTFNAGLSGDVFLTYASGSASQTTVFMQDVNEWLQSASASPFVAPTSGNSYAIAGAKFGRSYLYYVDSWAALRDGATGDLKNGYSSDGLHPGHAASTALGAAFRTAFLTAYPALTTSLRPAPTVGNQSIGGGFNTTVFAWNGASGTGGGLAFGATIFNTSSPPAASAIRMTYGATAQAGPTIVLATDLGTGFYRLTGASLDTSSNGPNGAPTANFIETATGKWNLTLTVATTSSLWLEGDFVNLLPNALFNTDHGVAGTKSGGIAVTGAVPANYNFSSSDSGICTISTGTHPTSGKNALILDLAGVPVNGGMTINCTDNALLNRLVQGMQVSRSALIEVQAGANGHLYGLYDVSVQLSMATAGSATRGAYTGVTHYDFTSLQGTYTFPMTDMDVGTAQLRKCLTPAMDISSPMTISGVSANLYVNCMDAKPVSARIYITENFAGVV